MQASVSAEKFIVNMGSKNRADSETSASNGARKGHRPTLALTLLFCFGTHAAAQDLTTERIATGLDEPLFAGAPAGRPGSATYVPNFGGNPLVLDQAKAEGSLEPRAEK